MENTPDKENFTYENYTYGKVFLRRIHWAKNSNTNTFWLSFEFRLQTNNDSIVFKVCFKVA